MEPLGNNSQPHAPPAPNDLEVTCRCAWPSAPHGLNSGPYGHSGGTIGRYQHNDGSKWQPTIKSWLCARLIVSHTLVQAFPQEERYKFRAVVGLFQFWAIQGVQALRRKLAEPNPERPILRLWLTRFVAPRSPPREMARNLRDQVGARLHPLRNRKRDPQPRPRYQPIDAELWLGEARRANDTEAIQWFTRTMTPAQHGPIEDTNKRRGKLPDLGQRWFHHKREFEDLARSHLKAITRAYQYYHLLESSLSHIRHLKQGYQQALRSEQEYNELVENDLEANILRLRLQT